ncbi:MAG: FKBP-type peptidyl-prolyl cis-trans isomerase [Patescibacteria group bacterium]
MSKSVYIFTILVIFVAIAVWFVVQRTREVNEVTETPMPTAVPTLSPTPEDSAGKPIKYDNGLVVQDVVTGGGKTAESGDTLSANYIGALENGTVFDNSYDRGQPIQFVLGSGQLIQGWELGLVGMKEGGKRRLIIPPELGYGARGAGKSIPPNATLLFEIELVSVQKK